MYGYANKDVAIRMCFVPAVIGSVFSVLLIHEARASTYSFSALNTANAWDLDDAGTVLTAASTDVYRIGAESWSKVSLPSYSDGISRVSDNGTLVGDLLASGPLHSTGVFTETTAGVIKTFAGAPGAATSIGGAVNNAGDVLGAALYPSKTNPKLSAFSVVFWKSGAKAETLGFLGGNSANPININNKDQLIANVTGLGSPSNHVVIWTNGITTKLANLGADGSDGADINDSGEVVGDTTYSTGVMHGVVWTNGKAIDVGALSGTKYSSLSDVNNSGLAVGTSFSNISTPGKAALWDGSKLIDLNTLLPAHPGITLTEGLDINNSGEILAAGLLNGKAMDFLLKPQATTAALKTSNAAAAFSVAAVPEPASIGLMALGMAGLLRRRRRGS